MNRVRSGVALILAGACTVASACGVASRCTAGGACGGNTGDAVVDAGPEAGPHDAAVPPAPWESCRLELDGGDPLAQPPLLHPSVEPWGPEWRSYPGMPTAITGRYAVEPERAAPALRWVPCANGAPACRESVIDWTDVSPNGAEPLLSINVLRGPVGRRFVEEVRYFPQPEVRSDITGHSRSSFSSLVLLSELDKEGAFWISALGSTNRSSCMTSIGPSANHHIGVSALLSTLRTTDASEPQSHGYFQAIVPLSLETGRITAREPVSISAPPQLSNMMPLPTSLERGMIFESGAGGLWFVPKGGAVATQPQYDNDGGAVGINGLFNAHDGVLGWATRAGYPVLYFDDQGTWDWMIWPGDGAVVRAFAWDAENDQLVWTEFTPLGDDPGQTLHVRLYTAPWSRHRASDQRTLRGEFEDTMGVTRYGGNLVAADGYAATIVNPLEVLVVELATGRTTTIRAGAHEFFYAALTVDRHEVWIRTAPEGAIKANWNKRFSLVDAFRPRPAAPKDDGGTNR